VRPWIAAAVLASAVVAVPAAPRFWLSPTPAVGQSPGVIEPRLERAMENAGHGERLPVLVELGRVAAPLPLSPSRELRAAEHASDLAALYEAALQALRFDAPGDVSAELATSSLIWAGGAVAAHLTADEVGVLAANPRVRRIYHDGLLEVTLAGPREDGIALSWSPDLAPAQVAGGALGSGLELIGAPTLWAAGATGAGSLVAIIDSGVDGAHPLLRGKWHGRTESALNAWFDPWGLTPTPVDDDGTGGIGHGTIVATIAVGSLEPGDTLFTSAGTQVVQGELEVVTGVAPGADWIAANAFEGFGGASYTRLSVLLQSMQWALDPDGDPATSTDVPDVVNNSWGLRPAGCDDVFDRAIDALEAAGIPVVFAAGNRGAGFDTVAAPAERADLLLNAFAVGATQTRGGEVLVAPNSLGGPSPCAPGAVKPEVVAPGEIPLVQRRTNTAAEVRGISGPFTSWAAPHASGALAVLAGLNRDAGSNDLKAALFSTATDLPPAGLDNESGAGLIDLPAAAEQVGGVGGVRLAIADWSWETHETRLEIRLANRGSAGFPGGVAELHRSRGKELIAAARAPMIAPGGVGVLSFGDLSRERFAGQTVSLRLGGFGGDLALSLRLAEVPASTVTLSDGPVRFSLDGNGRLGRVAGPVGFELAGSDWLTGGGFLLGGAERVSDGVYVDVLQQPGLKSNPVGSDTDWRSVEITPGETSALLMYADDRALRPLGASIRQSAELTALNDSAAFAIVQVISTFGPVREAAMAGVLLDWDFPSGDSVYWDAGLGASVMTAGGGAGPWMALTTHPRPPTTHAAVPLGTPSGGFYLDGSSAGVLGQLEGFTDGQKSLFLRLGGLQISGPDIADWSHLVAVGPLADGEAVNFLIAAGLSRDAMGRALEAARGVVEARSPSGAQTAAGSLELLPPFPNPFDPTRGEAIRIPYLVRRGAGSIRATLQVYTISGRLLFEERRTLTRESPLEPFVWDGRLSDGEPAATGVYGYVLQVGGQKREGKFLLLK
jgi:hypothetical protein